MSRFLSVITIVCVTAFAGLSILPGQVHGLRPAGLGGIDVILVPAGDDNGGGH